jgi:hypothetical protein
MNTSIHRPERCVPAQGWTIVDSRKVLVPLVNGTTEVTRLRNARKVADDRGQLHTIYSLDYYWFVGATEHTASHYARTWIDIRDRLLHGAPQQWAFITVVSNVTKSFRIFGRTEQETDSLIKSFIPELFAALRTAAAS